MGTAVRIVDYGAGNLASPPARQTARFTEARLPAP